MGGTSLQKDWRKEKNFNVYMFIQAFTNVGFEPSSLIWVGFSSVILIRENRIYDFKVISTSAKISSLLLETM